MKEEAEIRARLQAMVDRSPYNSWLGMHIASAGPDGVAIEAEWRCDFISAPERQALHGGVIAGLLDSAAVFAVMAQSGGAAATVDLRVDYHAIPAPLPMRLTGKVLRLGRTLGTADSALIDGKGRLVASGRATIVPLPATR
jgi:uncharacterized protein (TIGR00369 family)